MPGVQHACGHDAHTACLLTAAEILWEHREEVPGDIIFCFERGEEGGGNLYYLLKYIEEYHIRVDGCFGLHVLAGGRTGAALLTDGPLQAGNTAYTRYARSPSRESESAGKGRNRRKSDTARSRPTP